MLFKKFKDLADKKKQVFEEDIYALIDNEKNFKEKLYRIMESLFKMWNN